MTDGPADDDGDADPAHPPTDRESPVGEPVVRGDDAVADDQPAIAFDPDDFVNALFER